MNGHAAYILKIVLQRTLRNAAYDKDKKFINYDNTYWTEEYIYFDQTFSHGSHGILEVVDNKIECNMTFGMFSSFIESLKCD